MCTFRENTLDLGVFHRGILETQKFLKRVWYKFSYGMSALVVVSQIQVTSLWVKDNLTQFVFAASRLDAARVTKETIFRQIWIFGFHEFTKKKKGTCSLSRVARAQENQSFSNIWIQWASFVPSTVARATQMYWQGFTQSSISRTAFYNPPSPNPAAYGAL